MAKIIVGIDFGTSTTVVRWRKEDSDEIHVIKDGNGQSTVIDSAIFIPKDSDNWIFGKQALTQGNRKGELIRNFKMELINPESESQAEIYVRKFMEYIFQQFVKQTVGINYNAMDIYISFPVKWPAGKKTLMRNIISEVGFGQYGTIMTKTEPVAAAIELIRINTSNLIYKDILHLDKPLNVMMLDMGAGTSDLFFFQFTMAANGEIKIPEDKITQYPESASKYSYNCGGREIDEIISEEILQYLSKGMNKSVRKEWFDAKKAKEWKDNTLSEQLKIVEMIEENPSHIDSIIDMAEDIGQWNKTIGTYKISRNKFESITETHWANLYKLIENGMAKFKQDCGIGPEDIDLILLTGGHSQWYCTNKLFNGEGINGTIAVDSVKCKALNFSKIRQNTGCILQGPKPQETVANGLCWPGAINISLKAENNVWIRMGVDGFYCSYKQIVQKGEILPCKVKIDNKIAEDKYNTITISQNLIFNSNKFKLEFDILEGESIENATKSTFKYILDDESIFAKTLISLFVIPIFIRVSYKFSYSADIVLLEDGTLTLSGKLFFDGEEKINFTEKEFSIS